MLMATTPFAHFPTSPVICSASPQPNHHPKHNPTRQKLSPSPSNWWPPLFGWSSDPDYIQGSNSESNQESGEIQGHSEREASGRPTRSKFGLGCFTEDKAKELRKKTMESSTFHDIMYHSAIASRLASDASASGTGRRQER
ncbi:uncharacterized protein LOC113768675 [Coffea eugenioides]|uniref:uncharacterized protein LOC113768675 n=1 Tax=Coffea eugenioides TaxID=49369 RepID=UPI000F612A65|nr:uncharacterized protein LOC113768675 [Coffea eugenioides]